MKEEWSWLFKFDFNWMFHSWSKIDVTLFGFVKETGNNYTDYYFTIFGFGFGIRHLKINKIGHMKIREKDMDKDLIDKDLIDSQIIKNALDNSNIKK